MHLFKPDSKNVWQLITIHVSIIQATKKETYLLLYDSLCVGPASYKELFVFWRRKIMELKKKSNYLCACGKVSQVSPSFKFWKVHKHNGNLDVDAVLFLQYPECWNFCTSFSKTQYWDLKLYSQHRVKFALHIEKLLKCHAQLTSDIGSRSYTKL